MTDTPDPYVRIWLKQPSGTEVAMLGAADYRRVMTERAFALVEVERLRKIEAAAHKWAAAVEVAEEGEENSEEYLDACHELYVALGRTRLALN